MSSYYADRISQANTENTGYSPRSTVDENWAAGIGNALDNFNTIGMYKHRLNFDDRNYKLDNIMDQIPDEVKKAYKNYNVEIPEEYDYDSVAKWANENLKLDESIQTDQEIRTIRDGELKRRRDYANDIYERSTKMGSVAAFTGEAVGSVMDPINIVAGPLVGRLSMGSVAASRALFTAGVAGRSAVTGMVAAAAIEPFIYGWNKRTNNDYYGWQDAVFNIAAAGVFDAGISGLPAMFRHGAALRRQTKGELKRTLAASRISQAESMDAMQKHLDTITDEDEWLDYSAHMFEQEERYKNWVDFAENNKLETENIFNMFDELEILTNIDSPLDLQHRFEKLEALMEDFENGHVTQDTTPNVLDETPIPPRPKATLETVKTKTSEQTAALNPSAVMSQYRQAKQDMQDLLEDVDTARTEYKKAERNKRTEKRLANFQRVLKKTTDPEKMEKLQAKIASLEEEIAMREDGLFDEVIGDEADRALDTSFKEFHDATIKAKIDEVNELAERINLEKIQSPVERKIQELKDSDAPLTYHDPETGEVSEVIDELDDIAKETQILDDTITCMLGRSFG